MSTFTIYKEKTSGFRCTFTNFTLIRIADRLISIGLHSAYLVSVYVLQRIQAAIIITKTRLFVWIFLIYCVKWMVQNVSKYTKLQQMCPFVSVQFHALRRSLIILLKHFFFNFHFVCFFFYPASIHSVLVLYWITVWICVASHC